MKGNKSQKGKSVDEVFDMPDGEREVYIKKVLDDLDGKRITSEVLEFEDVNVTTNTVKALNILSGVLDLKPYQIIIKGLLYFWWSEKLLDNRMLAKLIASDKVQYNVTDEE